MKKGKDWRVGEGFLACVSCKTVAVLMSGSSGTSVPAVTPGGHLAQVSDRIKSVFYSLLAVMLQSLPWN